MHVQPEQETKSLFERQAKPHAFAVQTETYCNTYNATHFTQMYLHINITRKTTQNHR